ncbi:nucleotide exchange factor GrpE [Chloroflexota bacterium]
MPKKKNRKAEEAIQPKENFKIEGANHDGTPAKADSDLPIEDQDEVLEGEVVSDADLSPGDDSIPVEEKLELVQAALEASEAKASEYLDGWQRAKAEFTNYRKRQERERELARFETVGRVAKRYLPIVDDMERALNDRPTEMDGATWAEGIDLIYRKLMNILEAEGVTPIEAKGKIFDPNLHEAVIQTESDEHESGQVIEVLQTGYKMGDRVLRPATVRIAT